MTFLVISISYALLEITVRLMDYPDQNLVMELKSKMLKGEDGGKQSSDLALSPPAYGWDQIPIILSVEQDPAFNSSDFTVLFIGDSITRGFGLKDIKQEAYPALWHKEVAPKKGVHVINGAVQGFGIDQMILKLEQVLSSYQPDLVVFAYIPHDLWRVGRNYNWHNTKPILIDFGKNNWHIVPAPNRSQYFRDFANAERGFYRSIWSLTHVYENAPYYFPFFYRSYYQNLFYAIRNRLIKLTEAHNLKVLVTRLPITWPGDPVPFLDRMASLIFTGPDLSTGYSFVDLEGCVRSKAGAEKIDFQKAFKWHPDKKGHKILAHCIGKSLNNLIGQ